MVFKFAGYRESKHGDGNDGGEEPLSVLPKKQIKKKPGRMAEWPDTLLNDLVDIIVNNDYFKRKLIFTNSRNQKNTKVYQRVLVKLRICAAERDEECSFTVTQLRTKFKKAVAECRKVALTMKTATGIKSFQEENGYGLWFNQLFALVKTRDSCKLEKAIEPMATSFSQELSEGSLESPTRSISFFVPKVNSSKKKQKEDQLNKLLGIVRKMEEKNPMSEFLEYAKEEAENSRQHELQLFQLLMRHTSNSQFQSQSHSQNFH